jgi:phosphoglucomutase
MDKNSLAGRKAPSKMLINVPALVSAYYTEEPAGPVSFGTSGHRGSSIDGTFNEGHIAATSQAICELRKEQGISGPIFVGVDTHALSEPAFRTALEVFAGNGVNTVIHAGGEYTPTPVISFLILEHNRKKTPHMADGIVVTPSHNPPQDGGFKYNPPHGGPADVDMTSLIQERANQLIGHGLKGVARIPYKKARKADSTSEKDFIRPFIESLNEVVDMDAIKQAGLRIGVDPMGGAGVGFWEPIAERYGLNLEVVNKKVDPTFGFMTVDADGKIRMDCSSPFAMAGLISMADRFDIAWGNDPDVDRHGIVCRDGLMNPNHYLSVAIWYLLRNRPLWSDKVKIGKTLVSSSMIDRVVKGSGRELYEVPVGFKWFVDGLLRGWLAFGGEESAGAAFLRKNGSVWCTDKDGFCMTLLAAEILSKTDHSPSEIYRDTLVPEYGDPYYQRSDGPVDQEMKNSLKAISPESFAVKRLAGKEIQRVLTKAPGNEAPFGGLKVILEDGSWFAVRPSGTEPKMKVYIESFGGEALWREILDQALPAVFSGGAR